MSADPQHVQALFLRLVQLLPADRPAALDRECGADPELRRRVAALLQAHDEPDSYLDAPRAGLAATLGSEFVRSDSAATVEPTSNADGAHGSLGSRTRTTDHRPEAVAGEVMGGRYTLLEKIGEGGMGEVWVAKQTEPVKRKVALKLIKAGMDSRAVLQRFEQERQALGLMDHPHIARVFDGGMSPTGRPFFVMELVNGLPLNKFCDELKLTLKTRLELFVPICQAVQHAHQKGIVHRDLKPANILVTRIDGRPVPKVIDFGVAKATAGKLTAKSISTSFGGVVGTLEYMSPEQAGFSGDDIDTRADIFSLGVILYELLTGLRPIDANRLRKAALTEMLRIIQEEEPSKPSTRLSTDESLPSLAALRQTEPKKLMTLLRGDLDWVVMKCLEKQRDQRYETANGLARDIQRYLNDEPVEARPPSAGYRFKKFVKRHKGQVVAASLVLVALIVGMIGTTVGLLEARRQTKIARQQEIEAKQQEAEAVKQAGLARDEATAKEMALAEEARQRGVAEAIARFQTEFLATADPQKLLGDKVTVLQALEAAVKSLDQGALKDQPLVEAGVRYTIGGTLMGLGRYADAEPNLRKSLEIRRATLPTGHPNIAASLINLARLLMEQNKLTEAEPLFREALEICRKTLPAGDPGIAASLNNLARLLQSQNKLAEAEPLFREALEIMSKGFPPNDPDIAKCLNNLAGLLQTQNKLAEAEPLFREALEIRCKVFPAEHPDIAQSLHNLAELLKARNKRSEAEPLFRQSLQISRGVLPAGHPDIATCLHDLANLLQEQNNLAEAESLHREALKIRREVLPARHPDIAHSLTSLAELLRGQKKLAEAEPLCREALMIFREALPAGHPDIAKGLNNLALLLQAQNKLAEAEPLFREALEIVRAALPAGHPNIARGLNNLALLLQDQNKLAEAERLYRDALMIWRAPPLAGHPDIAA